MIIYHCFYSSIWLRLGDALKRIRLNGNHKSSETLQHNQNQCKLQTHSDSCLMTSFTRRDSEDYQTWLCICFNILSNKGLKLAKFHELSDTNTVTVHTSEYFTADW